MFIKVDLFLLRAVLEMGRVERGGGGGAAPKCLVGSADCLLVLLMWMQ